MAVAILAGGMGELVQEWTGSKGEWHDWAFHTLGCLPAACALVLGRLARRAEVPDGRPRASGRGAARRLGESTGPLL